MFKVHFSWNCEDAQEQSIVITMSPSCQLQAIYFSSASEELTTQEHSTQRENITILLLLIITHCSHYKANSSNCQKFLPFFYNYRAHGLVGPTHYDL